MHIARPAPETPLTPRPAPSRPSSGPGRAPRLRTAERILQTALALFNRDGEPQVSTTAIAAELGISPGNLYYHYPAKDALVNALYLRHAEALAGLLPAAGGVRDVEDAWFFLHSLFEHIGAYRFLYRDPSELLSRNRLLETQLRQEYLAVAAALRDMLEALTHAGAADLDSRSRDSTATCMAVVLTCWLSHDYVLAPRQAAEPGHAAATLLRGAHHVLALLAPYLAPQQRAHLQHLADSYLPADGAETDGAGLPP